MDSFHPVALNQQRESGRLGQVVGLAVQAALALAGDDVAERVEHFAVLAFRRVRLHGGDETVHEGQARVIRGVARVDGPGELRLLRSCLGFYSSKIL